MPADEPTFTDWVQLEADRHRPLLIDDDFSWSEPPSPRRRSRGSVSAAERERWVGHSYDEQAEPIDLERELDIAWHGSLSAPAAAETELAATYPGRTTDEVAEADMVAGTYQANAYELESEPPFDLSGRRTVVITGRGAERYAFRPRRSRRSELSFQERTGFSPDRTAMWAVLLGIALLLGCIVH